MEFLISAVVGLAAVAVGFLFFRHRYPVVTRIIDGDTVEINGSKPHVRLIGLQTPERGEADYYKAGLELAHIALRKRVRLVRFGKDRWKRTLGILWINGKTANLTMRKKYRSAKYDKLLTKTMIAELQKDGF